MISHGSIIAREYGIPAVVNVGGATRIIKTGQTIQVDGNRGVVTILQWPATCDGLRHARPPLLQQPLMNERRGEPDRRASA